MKEATMKKLHCYDYRLYLNNDRSIRPSLGLSMPTNLDRFKSDLEKLVTQGELLEYAMIREIDDKSFLKQARDQLGADKVDGFLKTLPDFKATYEAWYSESIALLRQLLPDRLQNFVSLYEKP
jgi:hypothetical protein